MKTLNLEAMGLQEIDRKKILVTQWGNSCVIAGLVIAFMLIYKRAS